MYTMCIAQIYTTKLNRINSDDFTRSNTQPKDWIYLLQGPATRQLQ